MQIFNRKYTVSEKNVPFLIQFLVRFILKIELKRLNFVEIVNKILRCTLKECTLSRLNCTRMSTKSVFKTY